MVNHSDMIRAFTHGRIFTPEIEIPDGTLLTRGSKIMAVGKASDIEVPAEAEVVDCTGRIVAPGFIDIHLHGGDGHDFLSGEGLAGAARFHASRGTTAMVPTLCPDTLPRLRDQLARLGRGYGAHEGPLPGILGLYLEGPFLNTAKRGAFDPSLICLPQPGVVRALFEASSGALRMMALAPELPGALETVREIKAMGMIPCLGHTDATYEETHAAFSNGVRHATHLFNAMKGFHHREPGAAMAALLHPEVSVEVILDDHHLHQATVDLLYRLKGAARMILISDAVPLAGRSEGSAMLGGQRVEVRDGKAVNGEGNLAGSLLTLADAVKRAVQWAHLPLKQTLRMATLNPARLLGLPDRKGRLAQGADADLVIMDQDLDVQGVYISGSQVPAPEIR